MFIFLKILKQSTSSPQVLIAVNPCECVLEPNFSPWGRSLATGKDGLSHAVRKLGFHERARRLRSPGGLATRPLLRWTGSVLTTRTATLLLPDGLCVNHGIAKPTHRSCTSPVQGPGPAPRRILPPVFTSVGALGPLCLLFPSHFLHTSWVFQLCPLSLPPSSRVIMSSSLSCSTVHSPAIIPFPGLA